jgi:deazaflavin-dependent oxidoreductase (nitroreductase family)
MTDTTPTAEPITTPPWFVRAVMGRMTRVLNPLIGQMAGRKHLKMVAKIHHQGRRSGKPYMTPASARLDDTTFWIPLTFGQGSDWCRNVRAAGGCTITWKGVDYRAARPVVIDRAAALSAARAAFKRRERAMLRLLAIREFLRLDLAGA